MATIEVVYSIRGERIPMRVAFQTDSEEEAFAYCRELRGPLAQCIHYTITHEDGRNLHDTRTDGLL